MAAMEGPRRDRTQEEVMAAVTMRSEHRARSRTQNIASYADSLSKNRDFNVLADPENRMAREVIERRLGATLAQPKMAGTTALRRPAGRAVAGKLHKSSRRIRSGQLPAENRNNPALPRPPISHDDINKGFLSLIERGFIGNNVDLTAALCRAPAPMAAGPVLLHDYEEQFERKQVADMSMSFDFSNLKLDVLPEDRKKPKYLPSLRKSSAGTGKTSWKQEEATVAAAEVAYSSKMATNEVERCSLSPEDQRHGQPKALTPPASREKPTMRSYDQMMDTFALHQFMIRRGNTLTSTPEFVSFKRTNQENWGAVSAIIRELELLFAHYAVYLAYIDGKQVANLAADEISALTLDKLLSCIVNLDQVAPLIHVPGQRYKGLQGEVAAAEKIQATVRMHLQRKNYAVFRRTTRAALVIQRFWRSRISIYHLVQALADLQTSRLNAFKQLQMTFFRRYASLKERKRVIIHLPSFGAESFQRHSMEYLATFQNSQMARLTSLQDPRVEVIYIAPFPLSDEILHYYYKILSLGGVQDAEKRLRVVTPENYLKFPEHFSLSTHLLYSPRAMRKIRTLIRGKDAYVVPSLVGVDDIKLCVALNVPLMGSLPDIANTYSTKSGAKRIFASAEVNTPPAAFDLFSEMEVYARLAALIVRNMDVQRWILKIDDEFGGRGHAHIDVGSLESYAILLRDYQSLTDEEWLHPTVQAAAVERLQDELQQNLHKHVVVARKSIYRKFKQYLEAFTRVGGVIEACPPEIRGSPSANLYIEPNGAITVLSTHDQIFYKDYSFLGATFPQLSVPPVALHSACLAIGNALYAKQIIGYVGVDFVTFWDEPEMTQRLWAVDLNIRMTDTAVAFNLFHFVSRGRFDASSGNYYLPAAEGKEPETRSFVIHNSLQHPNLSTLHYNVFFGLCRSKGITFELEEKIGSIFHLVDSFARGTLGLLCCARKQSEALGIFVSNLEFINAQLGPVKDQRDSIGTGKPNFTESMGILRNLKPVYAHLEALPHGLRVSQLSNTERSDMDDDDSIISENYSETASAR